MQKYKTAILFISFISIVFIFLIYLLIPEVPKFIEVAKEVRTKSTELEDLERKLATLKATAMEKANEEPSKNIYKADSPGMDVESTFTVIFDDIIEMAKFNGIKVYSIGYAYNPTDDEVVIGASGKYNVCLVNMQIIADYTDTESFLRELYKYPYLINIDKVESIPYSKNKKVLITNLQLKLYSQK
jgi:hypothetical protein